MAAVIQPDSILSQLGDLWTTMAKPEDETSQDGAVLRACAMTFISFVDDEEDAMALGETIAHLMKEHPSRAIVVRVREGENFLDSRVFAQCWMPFGHRRQICCEQVEFTCTMDHLPDVAAVIGSLAVPDLPKVILLRSARIVRAGALRKVLPLGDKIIVDSSRVGAPGFGELGGLLDTGHITGDLAWTRITEVRALLAQLLDEREPAHIVIEYSGKEAGPEARYLEAWLEGALPRTQVGLKGSGEAGNGKINAIRVDNDDSITLRERVAEYDVGNLHQCASMARCSDEELLNTELSIVVHDRVFEQALNRITG